MPKLGFLPGAMRVKEKSYVRRILHAYADGTYVCIT